MHTGDFETDLRAFGLGELPPELLERLDAESESTGTPAEEPVVEILSSDIYLQDLEMGASFAGAFGDELAALTGGAEVSRPRPVTQVAWVPEPGANSIIKRDETVDADLVRSIISGIEKL